MQGRHKYRVTAASCKNAPDATVLFSFLTWLVYLLLIFYRMSGWRGRKAAYLSIVGFIGVLVTLVGANYFGGLHTLQ